MKKIGLLILPFLFSGCFLFSDVVKSERLESSAGGFEQTEYEYSFGRLVRMTETSSRFTNENVTVYEYDSSGRRALYSYSEGGNEIYRVETTYFDDGRTNTRYFDVHGEEIKQGTNVFTYDEDGRLEKSFFRSTLNYDTTTETIRYSYTSKGQIKQVKQSFFDGYELTVNFAYDDEGRTNRIVYATDSDWQKYEFEYDETGRAVKMVYCTSDGLTNIKTTEFDSSGNLALLKTDYGSGVWESYSYDYDESGNLLKESYENSYGDETITSYSYAKSGRLLEKEIVSGTLTTLTIYDYDLFGRLKSERVEYPGGTWEEAVYSY